MDGRVGTIDAHAIWLNTRHAFVLAGVARSNAGDHPASECDWEMVGLLPLYDPPRHDCVDTIKYALRPAQ